MLESIRLALIIPAKIAWPGVMLGDTAVFFLLWFVVWSLFWRIGSLGFLGLREDRAERFHLQMALGFAVVCSFTAAWEPWYMYVLQVPGLLFLKMGFVHGRCSLGAPSGPTNVWGPY